jgi:ABC-type iron transport system FetAB ATPase subunit
MTTVATAAENLYDNLIFPWQSSAINHEGARTQFALDAQALVDAAIEQARAEFAYDGPKPDALEIRLMNNLGACHESIDTLRRLIVRQAE